MRKIVYMEWVKTRPPARYEIGGSGVVPVSIEELPEARESLAINDFNLYGYKPLVQALADRYELKPEQVVTTQGTSMANYLAIAAVVKAGDEVLVEDPAYEPLLDIPEMLGCKIERFKRRFHDGYQLKLTDLAKRVNKRTKLIILTNLHNPSGALLTNEVLAEVGAMAQKVGAYVLVDEVYMDFLFERRPKSSVHLGDNFVVTCSLTKVYGFDGLRCGWVFANPEVAKAMWRLQDFFGVNGAIPAEKASVEAFRHLGRFVERTRRIINTNRPMVDRFMAEQEGKLAWVAPEAGPVCFPKLLEGSAKEFCERLRSEYEVGVIPGEFFESGKHFRVGFGGRTENLQAGLERLGEALSRWPA